MLLYIVPSRGRPGNIARLVEAWRETEKAGARLWVRVDDDDPELAAYQSLDLGIHGLLITGPRLRLGPTLNELALAAVSARVRTGIDPAAPSTLAGVGFMGDDHVPRTGGWDGRIQEELFLGADVVYGNDLLQGQNLPTAVAMSVPILRALGYFCPPGMTHLYLDNVWKKVGELAGGLRYLDDVIIEHVHPVAKKAEWDSLYSEVNSQEQYHADYEKYDLWWREGSPEYVGWRQRIADMLRSRRIETVQGI